MKRLIKYLKIAVLPGTAAAYGIEKVLSRYQKPGLVKMEDLLQKKIWTFVLLLLIGILASIAPSIRIWQLRTANPADYVLLWIGLSILIKAFPSQEEASEFKNEGPAARFLYYTSLGSAYGLQFAYAAGIAYMVPLLLLWIVAGLYIIL